MIRTENISLRSAVRAIRAFAARETVLIVAVAAALASCALVPPDAGYAAYVDWRTLALLFCLMAVVAGFRSLGVLDAVGAWLVARARTQRAVAGVLVGLAFFASMAVTNDVALITFVPLALVVLRRAGMETRTIKNFQVCYALGGFIFTFLPGFLTETFGTYLVSYAALLAMLVVAAVIVIGVYTATDKRANPDA